MQNDKEKFKEAFKRRLYTFTLKLIEFLDKLPKDSVTHRLGDQLLRSGTGVLSNYIEGQASSSKKEFTNYFQISLKSSNESKVWFALLRDSKRAKPQDVMVSGRIAGVFKYSGLQHYNIEREAIIFNFDLSF